MAEWDPQLEVGDAVQKQKQHIERWVLFILLCYYYVYYHNSVVVEAWYSFPTTSTTFHQVPYRTNSFHPNTNIPSMTTHFSHISQCSFIRNPLLTFNDVLSGKRRKLFCRLCLKNNDIHQSDVKIDISKQNTALKLTKDLDNNNNGNNSTVLKNSVRQIIQYLIDRLDNSDPSCTVDVVFINTSNTALKKNKNNIATTSTTRLSKQKVPVEWKKVQNYLYHNPRITKHTVEQIINFLSKEFPNDTFIQKNIIQTCPRILSQNLQTKLIPTTQFLKNDLYSQNDMYYTAILKNPNLLLSTGLGYNDDTNLQLIELYLAESNDVHLSHKQIQQLKIKSPSTFQLSLVQVLSVIQFLNETLYDTNTENTDNSIRRDYVDSMIVTRKLIGKIILSYPQILQLSVENNLRPSIYFLMDRCQLTKSDIIKLFQQDVSTIIGLSTKNNLQPKLDLFLSLLNNNKEQLKKVILSHPSILGLSLHNIETKIKYFNSIDTLKSNLSSKTKNRNVRADTYGNAQSSFTKITDGGLLSLSSSSSLRIRSLASRILIQSPTVYSLSLFNNIVPTINYLAQLWGVDAPSNPLLSIDDDRYVENDDDNNSRSKLKLTPNQNSSKNKDDTPTGTVKPLTNSRNIALTYNDDKASLSSLIGEYPAILTLSLEGNIQPTVDFFNRTGYLESLSSGRNKASTQLVTNTGTGNNTIDSESVTFTTGSRTLIRGRYIAASLSNRLLPRWHYVMSLRHQQLPMQKLVSNDIVSYNSTAGSVRMDTVEMTESSKISEVTAVITTNTTKAGEITIPLHLLVSATDVMFCNYYDINYDDYCQFKKESIPLLKFRSQFDVWLKTGRPIDL